MTEVDQLFGEAKVMAPIYRMVKLISQEDEQKAQIAMAVTVQTITDHYFGKHLTPKDVQEILRRVLIFQEGGRFYAPYLFNELQVQVAGWLTLLAIDRPVTVGDLGELADTLAQGLAAKNVLDLSSEDVLGLIKEKVAAIDGVVYERMVLNEAHFREALETILPKTGA